MTTDQKRKFVSKLFLQDCIFPLEELSNDSVIYFWAGIVQIAGLWKDYREDNSGRFDATFCPYGTSLKRNQYVNFDEKKDFYVISSFGVHCYKLQ